MPLYEYECGKCSHRFELRKSFSEGSSAQCPKCHSDALRVFAPVPIVFKGSGFYVTDYLKDKSRAMAEKSEFKSETKSCSECKADKRAVADSPACKN